MPRATPSTPTTQLPLLSRFPRRNQARRQPWFQLRHSHDHCLTTNKVPTRSPIWCDSAPVWRHLIQEFALSLPNEKENTANTGVDGSHELTGRRCGVSSWTCRHAAEVGRGGFFLETDATLCGREPQITGISHARISPDYRRLPSRQRDDWPTPQGAIP